MYRRCLRRAQQTSFLVWRCSPLIIPSWMDSFSTSRLSRRERKRRSVCVSSSYATRGKKQGHFFVDLRLVARKEKTSLSETLLRFSSMSTFNRKKPSVFLGWLSSRSYGNDLTEKASEGLGDPFEPLSFNLRQNDMILSAQTNECYF